jgi:hypothetical protein
LVKSVEDTLEKIHRTGSNPLKSTDKKAKVKEA